jgi:hypothetical protein
MVAKLKIQIEKMLHILPLLFIQVAISYDVSQAELYRYMQSNGLWAYTDTLKKIPKDTKEFYEHKDGGWHIIRDHPNVTSNHQSPEKAPADSNDELKPLITHIEWGINQESLKKIYPRPPNLVEAHPGLLLDLSVQFYGQNCHAGFTFGQNGLHNVIVSYLFKKDGFALNKQDVLAISIGILNNLIIDYGKPLITFPWDGKTFSYIWLSNDSIVQFAWSGDDNWGVQFRSKNLDPEGRLLLKALKKD